MIQVINKPGNKRAQYLTPPQGDLQYLCDLNRRSTGRVIYFNERDALVIKDGVCNTYYTIVEDKGKGKRRG